MSKAVSTLVIWDSTELPPKGLGTVCCWNGYAELEEGYSVLRYVEANSERLRNKYLIWIHDVGEYKFCGKRLIDWLDMGEGLSYWWLTLLVEKSHYKSPITDAIRLLALDEILGLEKPRSLRLVSASRLLNETISNMCRESNIPYEWQKQKSAQAGRIELTSVYRALPHPVQALFAFVRHVWLRWPLTRTDKSGWLQGDRKMFFCSYFDNVDTQAAIHGRFYSDYWGDLSSHLARNGYKSNWLQRYIPCTSVASPRIAESWTRRFNSAREAQGFHSFDDANLSLRIVLRVIRQLVWLSLTAWRLPDIKLAFRPKGSRISLWPLMRGDWRASLCGASAVNGLLAKELLDETLRNLPHHRTGFYLCENQGWERALIHAWRKHGHGRLIGVAHATVRFWDLRYFYDVRTLCQVARCAMPQPDLIALNGQVAVDAYFDAGYPKELVVECEALRYIYLGRFRGNRRKIPGRGGRNKVLILGGFMEISTHRLLKVLEESVAYRPNAMSYAVKPHPNSVVRAIDYPSLSITIVNDPLATILQDYDVAYCSNTTSAAVDAYLAGMPVVVLLDEAELNFSPLRDRPGVMFVSTSRELAEALRVEDRDAADRVEKNDFFFLDKNLSRWSRLLEN